jgi:hypothetical protein
MNLVTYTCSRDIRQMRLQAESIQQFLVTPCIHYVIVTDTGVTELRKKRWLKVLSPYYKKQQLRIWFPEDLKNIIIPTDIQERRTFAYMLGQKYWLNMAKLTNTDFVLLVSKNFFIRPVLLSEWKNDIGPGMCLTDKEWKDTYEYDPRWKLANLAYAEYFKVEPLTKLLKCINPAVISINKLRKLDQQKFNNFWVSTIGKFYSADLIFYSYLLDPEDFDKILTNPPRRKFRVLSKGDFSNFEEELALISNSRNIKVSGFDRRFLSMLTTEQFNKVQDWIQGLGLNTRLTRIKNHKANY